MMRKIKILTLATTLILSILSVSAINVGALELHSVRGDVYVNDVIVGEGITVKIAFPSGDETDDTSETGRYQIDFQGHDDETGVFSVKYNNVWYTPSDNKTIFIEAGETTPYVIDLHIETVGVPIADANGPYSATVNTAVTLDGSGSYDPDGTITLYEWDFNGDLTYDWSSPNTGVTTHTYTSTGTYTVWLRVTDNDGKTGIDSATVSITSGGGGNGGGGGGGLFIPTNKAPTADASLSDTTGFTNTPVNFDGSLSTDSDGTITSWEWTFGDGNTGTGETTTHTYTDPGTYDVTLKVTDNNGAYDTDTITVDVAKPNTPPIPPVITGPTMGTQNTAYTYEFTSTDADDDTIKYTITWGDTTTDTSEFLDNGTTYSISHTFTSAGIYTITATANDNQTDSSPSTYLVLIDVHYVHERGYLLDTDSDGTYDEFYSNETSIQCATTVDGDGYYVIDINCNDTCTFRYNMETDEILDCAVQEDNLWMYLLLLLLLIIILGALYFLGKRRKTTAAPPPEKPKGQKKSSGKKTTKK